MMKKQVLVYFVLILSVFYGKGLQAQNTNQASVTGRIFAEVISAFSAVETSQMNFGRFSPGPYGGKIILTPQGTISVLGSVVKGSGLHNAASFYVTGDSYANFSVSLPDSPATLTNTASARTMKVSDWISVPSPGPGAGTLQDGYQTVYVGATLEVGTLNDNPVGLYTGTYTITFDFN
ncbi:MAG: DUF4402 domain-containing protein [Bacteroidales bacterium]